MGCGCSKKPSNGYAATAAALCHVCIYAEHNPVDPWNEGAVRCTINGYPIHKAMPIPPCPKKKHPDKQGVTRWLYVRWYGLPFPIRLWLWATHQSHRRPSWWTGCGCSVFLKGLVGRIKGKEPSHA